MLRGKPKAQKEKTLPQLNHFLTEKVAKSVVRSIFLIYHLFAVRIRLLILLCLRIVLPQTPALPLSEMLSLRMQTR